jgi:hypothetical protein
LHLTFSVVPSRRAENPPACQTISHKGHTPQLLNIGNHQCSGLKRNISTIKSINPVSSWRLQQINLFTGITPKMQKFLREYSFQTKEKVHMSINVKKIGANFYNLSTTD